MRKLRVPVALAFALTACGGGDDGGECQQTREPCVQSPTSTEVCEPNTCVDSNGSCPIGCIPAGSKFYCVPDGTTPNTCPSPIVCIGPGQSCPGGCTPVG